MGTCLSKRNERPQLTAGVSGVLTISGRSPEHPEQEQGKVETPEPGDHWQSQHEPSSSDPAIHTSDDEEMVITHIRATDVALGLRRIPAGFYTVVHHSGREWRTENKRSSVNDDVVEWIGPIPIPSDISAAVRIKVYATFEFRPMLGSGERLREFTITVEQLLDRSAKDTPFTLFPKDGDLVSPCSSILVTLKRQKCESSNSSASRVISPHRSNTESRGELEDATNHGHSILSCYRRHGKARDLERSIREFGRALSICPADHPCHAAAQSNLAMAKFIHCHVEGTSLEVPCTLYRNVLAARPAGHVDRPATLIQLSAVHLALFKKNEHEAEGAYAEALLHEAIELSATESHENQVATFMLRMHAEVQADNQSLPEDDSAASFTDGHLWTSSSRFMDRFQQFGDLADLQQAITLLEELVGSTSVSDDWYSAGLVTLGSALLHLFIHLREPNDLQRSISVLKDVVDLIPHDDLQKPCLLHCLGKSLKCRFDCFGKPSDLEDAISMLMKAVDLTPRCHPDKFSRLHDLGISLGTRFECLGELSDLEHAISMYRDALDLTPDGHSDRPGYLTSLGNAHLSRFKHLGELSDLDDAISTFKNAVELTPHDHPDKPARLTNLGISSNALFERLGELNDLQGAISLLKDAVDLTPSGHPDKPSRLSNLSSSLSNRFWRLGELDDLECGIRMLKEAIKLLAYGHPDKPVCLNNLSSLLTVRFDRFGELGDLECAISILEETLDITPDGRPERPGRLNNLGKSLLHRFLRVGELSDLERAISMCKNAVSLAARGHSGKLACLNTLGNSLLCRFERIGELSDLEDAISTLKDAVSSLPVGHPGHQWLLHNLGCSLLYRFERLGERNDLEDAISMLQHSIDLVPNGHPDKAKYLRDLACPLSIRFERFGDSSDIDRAVSVLNDAVELTPHGHPDRQVVLGFLGNTFGIRFRELGELNDIDLAVSRHIDAVGLTPHGHPDAGHLSNLGNSFFHRFKHLGELSDLERAISMLTEAVYLTPHDHPGKSGLLDSLGNSLRARFEHLENPSDFEQTLSLYSQAACDPIGPAKARIRASQNWISCARRIRHHSLLHAYSVTISLLPQVAWSGLSLVDRYNNLRGDAAIVREGAATALDLGFPETAVEWLEQGRSIIWGELFQLRRSYEELSPVYPDHARRLQELSAALEHASTTREQSLSAILAQSPSAIRRTLESLRQEKDRQRALAIERDKLLQEIRGFPGFEQFLLRETFSQLRSSARAGPVVMLNAAESRCDALIVLADVDHVIHVPLPDFTFQRSAGLQKMLEILLGDARVIRSDDREGGRAKLRGISWESLLCTLWNDVVKPVLDALAFSTPGDLSRIFWCPTGPFTFLPIHAAGLYGTQHSQTGNKVSDFVVSSYTPSLSFLALSSNPNVRPSGDLRLLAVGQPPSDGLPRLPGVDTEMEHIRALISNSLSGTTLLEPFVGTVEEVLPLMKEADWVHFACHGIQDVDMPTESGLCLANRRRLKLRDIIALSRPLGGLAFLSACQTAMGDEYLSNEAIHIAAGMLFAGYGGVVATMWSISDNLAPDVARDVYEQLFQNGTRPDYREAAWALHEAIGRLREGGRASFVKWLPFIHVGL